MSAFWKDLIREIKNTPGRYISLLIITFLGASTIVGIKATAVDMRNAGDKLYKEHSLYDLQLKSTTGFTDEDAAALSGESGVLSVMPTYIYDAFLSIDNENRAVRAYALPGELNKITLLEGRLPEKAGECLIEADLSEESGFQTGDSIILNLDDPDEYSEAFTEDTFTVTGVITSPLYITFQRGNTTLGDGALQYYIYLYPEAFAFEIYTDVYIKMEDSAALHNVSDEYNAAAEEWKTLIEKAGGVRAELKREELSKAQEDLDRGLEDYNEGLKALESELADARGELENAKRSLDGAKSDLEIGQKALDSRISEAAEEMEKMAALLPAEQLAAARAELEAERIKAQAEIDGGWTEYKNGLKEYNGGISSLNTREAEARAELAAARQELSDAQAKLDSVPEPEWFVYTRKEGLAFDSYFQDTLRLEKIGYIFPLMFFLVAVMVSLTSMSRMVENHRTQIGIYKALGYRPAAILMKYLIYAFSAGIAGGITGVIFGSWLFPTVIADAYTHIYHNLKIETPVPLPTAATAVIISVSAVLAVTLGTYISSMKGAPALLMRPKPPAKGKRVLLERAGFIWNRLSFFSKVSVRNVFRYKRRVIMTLAGVAGCSALMLTGFGLRDSIGGVAELQYSRVMSFDLTAYTKEIKSEEQRMEAEALLPESSLFVREETVTAQGKNGSSSASLFVPEDPGVISEYINLYSPKTNSEIKMTDDGIIITDKLAKTMGVSAGDDFKLTLGNGRVFSARVTGITENYLQHYLYISPEYYKAIFDAEPFPNSVVIKEKNTQELAAALLENNIFRAVVQNEELVSIISESTDAMDVVTVILILLACALALVVLFNLTNINISERFRELATIKVLGFNDAEMAAYIYRENGVITVLGIALGLVGGVFLHRFVITSVELDVIKFPLIIKPHSYIAAALLSGVFAVFVNLVMRFKLKRIDMVESLKSVE